MQIRFLSAQFLALCGAILYIFHISVGETASCIRCSCFRICFIRFIFFVLGAATGGAGYILNLARSMFLAGKWEFARGKKMCAILCTLQVAVAVVAWSGWISLLPVCANIAATIGGYTHNAQKIRFTTMVFNSPLWIVYDIIIGSWVGVTDELTGEISAMISIRRYGWKNLGDVRE